MIQVRGLGCNVVVIVERRVASPSTSSAVQRFARLAVRASRTEGDVDASAAAPDSKAISRRSYSVSLEMVQGDADGQSA